MSGTFWRLAAARSSAPAAVAAATACFLPSLLWQQQQQPQTAGVVRCDAAAAPAAVQPQQQHVAAVNQPPPSGSSNKNIDSDAATSKVENNKSAFVQQQQEGMQPDAAGNFHNLFPLRQLFVPAVPYPLWNKNWDGRQPVSTGDPDQDRRAQRHLRKTGVTRHIILVRHGQYDETSKDDDKRILTPLGREQAHLTGQRLAEMLTMMQEQEAGAGGGAGCRVKALRVSGLARAIETAEIIASHLPGVTVEAHDAMLNEGRPCHTIPGAPANPKIIETTDHHHPRIEAAFRKLFYRADPPNEGDDEPAESKHEFEIIVCHANVIRYWLCRALQLPPEAWLRYCPFNCSLTYLTIRPTGTVSCRMLGDIGHLPYRACTFSGHHGYNW